MLAMECRFRDCRHETELGCAVRSAIEDGTLDAARFANYRKTERELARLARKEHFTGKRHKKKTAARGREAGEKAGKGKYAGKGYAED